jgi:hypothetical protein
MKLIVNWLNVTNGVPAQVQVIVEEGGFRDALYYATDTDRLNAAAAGNLTREAQARIDAWTVATTPGRAPSKEEEQALLDTMLTDKVRIDAALAKSDPVEVAARKAVLGIALEAQPDEQVKL